MAKEINEKTFELNITNELLNLSKSFIWYSEDSPISHLLPRDIWLNFMNQTTLFAEGLTQKEESNEGGGYDVSININNPHLTDKRLMMLQFKSGISRNYHRKNPDSQFHFSKKPAHFIEFTLNDAADKRQHLILRKLADNPNIQSESVMYVFPRITTRSEFDAKIGKLISNTSFVPVLEIDRQGLNQKPPVVIKRNSLHKYRISYDGTISEVNLLLLLLLYDQSTATDFFSELICIQIERFAKILIENDKPDLEIFLDGLSNNLNRFVEYELKQFPLRNLLIKNIESYILRIREDYLSNRTIPKAPSKYTTVLPIEGLKLKFEEKNDFSRINYQIF